MKGKVGTLSTDFSSLSPVLSGLKDSQGCMSCFRWHGWRMSGLASDVKSLFWHMTAYAFPIELKQSVSGIHIWIDPNRLSSGDYACVIMLDVAEGGEVHLAWRASGDIEDDGMRERGKWITRPLKWNSGSLDWVQMNTREPTPLTPWHTDSTTPKDQTLVPPPLHVSPWRPSSSAQSAPNWGCVLIFHFNEAFRTLPMLTGHGKAPCPLITQRTLAASWRFLSSLMGKQGNGQDSYGWGAPN